MQNMKYKIRYYNIPTIDNFSLPEIVNMEDEMNKEYNDGWKVRSTNVINISGANIIMVIYENMRNNILCD